METHSHQWLLIENTVTESFCVSLMICMQILFSGKPLVISPSDLHQFQYVWDSETSKYNINDFTPHTVM